MVSHAMCTYFHVFCYVEGCTDGRSIFCYVLHIAFPVDCRLSYLTKVMNLVKLFL